MEAGQKINVGQTGVTDTKLRYVLKKNPTSECGKADWETGGTALVTQYNANPIELTADHITSIADATSVVLEIQANNDLFNSECTPAIAVKNGDTEVADAVTESSPKFEFAGLGNYKPIATFAFDLDADELSKYEKVVVKFGSSAFSGKLQTELVRNSEDIYDKTYGEGTNSVAQQYGMTASDDMTAELSLSKLTHATNKSGILIQTSDNGTTTFKGKITVKEVKLIGKK